MVYKSIPLRDGRKKLLFTEKGIHWVGVFICLVDFGFKRKAAAKMVKHVIENINH